MDKNIQVGLADDFKIYSEAELKQAAPYAEFDAEFDFKEHLKSTQESATNANIIAEFNTTGDISADFFYRQEYEIEAGRKEVPMLWEGIYDRMVNANFPKTFAIDTLGPLGLTFDIVPEGGEVSFATIGEGTRSLSMQKVAQGIAYTEDMFMYNQTWLFPGLERDIGNVFNARINHIHLNPIITGTPAGTTDGASLTPDTFRATEPIELKYLRTLEAAIAAGLDDTDVEKQRSGPYVLLMSTIDAMIMMRALRVVPQEGVARQGDMMGVVSAIVAYNGFVAQRGAEPVTFPGVPTGEAYLIHVGNRRHDYLSRWKHDLRRRSGDAELARYILAKDFFDARLATYANPSRTVQKILLPASTDGGS